VRHNEQVRLIEELLARLDAGVNVDAGGIRRNPTEVYVDPALAEREWETFFRGHPQVVGLSGDLPEPGSFLTVDDLGVPILVARGDDGQVRAFVNACRHRGAIVEARPHGETHRFTCPFHAWTYDLAGDLVGVPKEDHVGRVERSCNGLVALPAIEAHGLLWVHPDPAGSIDPDALLTPELADELDSWNLGELVHLGADTYEVECNWKLAMDTFGETYHFPVLHRDTLAQGFYGNVQAYDTFGRNHRMLLVRRTIDDLRELPEDEWDITVATLPAYWLFPNVQLLPFFDGCFLVRAYPVPGEPGRHVSRITFYLWPGVHAATDTAGFAQQLGLAELFGGVIRDEDYVIAAAQQRTASSGALPSVLFGRNEPALHHYHQTYRAALDLDPLPLLDEAAAPT
jgi:phenylpropionate dioxygenase-like ring-hydroxylating dioxygenase large terminal subunit